MKSMTCYAYKESAKENITVSAEIKGYNSRFLDISIHLPSWLSSLETRIREYLASHFSRGKIDAGIRIKDKKAFVNVSVNENAANVYDKSLKELAKFLGIEEKPGLEVFLGLEGILETEIDRDAEEYWELIKPVLAAAAEQAEAERIREGEHTARDILSHIAVLERCAGIIRSHVPEIEAATKENLRTRFAELLGDKIDESRILAETAVLLMKHSISEELSRLSCHLADFRLEIEQNLGNCSSRGSSLGRKLDFLSQEINREINTIGSKTPILEVSRAVIEMKNALENIREQLRNVE